MSHPPQPTAAALMASVADSDDSAYRLSGAWELLEVNAGFLRFAHENADRSSTEPWSNRSVLLAVTEPLRAFFDAAFARVHETRTPWQHEYECSSPAQQRTFRMTVYPVGAELVVVHALRCSGPHAELVCAPDDIYTQHGMIKMCSNCRRVQNPRGHKRWDWVPAYLTHAPVQVSHGLCEPCARYYWP